MRAKEAKKKCAVVLNLLKNKVAEMKRSQHLAPVDTNLLSCQLLRPKASLFSPQLSYCYMYLIPPRSCKERYLIPLVIYASLKYWDRKLLALGIFFLSSLTTTRSLVTSFAIFFKLGCCALCVLWIVSHGAPWFSILPWSLGNLHFLTQSNVHYAVGKQEQCYTVLESAHW